MDPWERLTGVWKGIPSCSISTAVGGVCGFTAAWHAVNPRNLGGAISAVGVSGQSTLGKRTPGLPIFFPFDMTGD